jgi:RNA polymerase sigma-70 factor, ECF subfamily
MGTKVSKVTPARPFSNSPVPPGGDDSTPRDPQCPTDVSRVLAARKVEAAELGELLALVGGGDANAFASFYDRTSARVYGVALRVLRDAGFAEETTQEIYLQVWRTASSFDPAKGSAPAWLMTLAHRRAVDRVRSEQSHTDREFTYGTQNLPGEFDTVIEEVWDRIERRAVLECLNTLTSSQRESIELAYYGGYTYREVADHLGVGVSAIKSRIRDGLIRLRGCLAVS